jgi:hypothetical protein
MYGKAFATMYEGSMVGAGAHVFAVWGYCIAKADPDSHTVNLNPALLSPIIGETVERINAAIEYLCSPDEHSHNDDQGGRRITKASGYEYFLVSHEHYRNIRSNMELRQYFREEKRKQRKLDVVQDMSKTCPRHSKTVQDSPRHPNVVQDIPRLSQTPASASASESVSDLKGDCQGVVVTVESRSGPQIDEFEAFWQAYPKKKSKYQTAQAWSRNNPERPPTSELLSKLKRQRKWPEWKKENGQYIPNPDNYLSNALWLDEAKTEYITEQAQQSGAIDCNER